MGVVDRLTKYAHFCALSHPFSASTIAATFVDTIQKLHGNAQIIVSDTDPIVIGKIWTELFIVWGPSWLTTHLIILDLMGKQRY